MGQADILLSINQDDIKEWERTNRISDKFYSIQYLTRESQNIKDGDTAQFLKELKAVLDAFKYGPNSRPNFLEFTNKLKTVQGRLPSEITEWEEELKNLSLLT